MLNAALTCKFNRIKQSFYKLKLNELFSITAVF